MARARQVVEAGLAARDAARIKVRQPLASIALPGDPLPEEIAAIVRDELNVKALIFGAPEVKLDTEITEELQLEGLAREVVRVIQDRRKKLGFNVEDRIHTRYEADGMLVARHREARRLHQDARRCPSRSSRAGPTDFDGEQQMLEGEQIWIGLKRSLTTPGRVALRGRSRSCVFVAGPPDQEPRDAPTSRTGPRSR